MTTTLIERKGVTVPAERCPECGLIQPEILVMLHEPWCRYGNALKAESEQALSRLQREAGQAVLSL